MLVNHSSPTCRPLLPYGTLDLDPVIVTDSNSPPRVRCYVRGCTRFVQPPTRTSRDDCCPIHQIRCHLSGSSKATYSYTDVRRNIIASPDLFATRIVGHPFKYESHRLGAENSEDALTWNVFRSLQEAGCLHEVARWITGQDIETEPTLFLWGIELTDDRLEPWDLLVAARERFERNLPVMRPLTEPDIALFLPGHYLVLIEAKFTSPNTFYCDGPRKDAGSLTKAELLEIYNDQQLKILDLGRATESPTVFNQLWRNIVFAEWMAAADGRGTWAYHASLTRAGTENESSEGFRKLVQPEFSDRFVHVAWEDIYHLCDPGSTKCSRLQRYIECKTAGLQAAFRV